MDSHKEEEKWKQDSSGTGEESTAGEENAEKKLNDEPVVEEETAETAGKTEEINDFQSDLDELQKKLEEAEDRALRVQAELANVQKRNSKERQDAAQYRSQALGSDLLPVVDGLEKALETDVDDEKAQSLKKGVEIVLKLMKEALKKEGIEEIDALHKPFDPTLHQSIQTQPAKEGEEPGTVVLVAQKGYTIKERVLRPAMVIVAE